MPDKVHIYAANKGRMSLALGCITEVQRLRSILTCSHLQTRFSFSRFQGKNIKKTNLIC